MFALVEFAWNLLDGEALHKLFMNTRLKSGDVEPNPHRWPTTHPLYFSAYPFDCQLTVHQKPPGKQVLCRL